MLKHIGSVATIVACLTFTACERQAESSKRFADPPVTDGAEKTKTSRPAGSDSPAAEYQNKVRAELEKFDRLIADLKRNAQDVKAETSEEVSQALEDLEVKKQVLQNRLKEFESASAEAAQRIQSEVEKALEDLRKSYEQTASAVK